MMQNSCTIQSSLLDLFSYVCQPPVQKFHHLLKFKQQSKHFPQLTTYLVVRNFLFLFSFCSRTVISSTPTYISHSVMDDTKAGNNPSQSINYHVIIQETTLTSIKYHVIFSGIPQAINQLPCNYLWNNPSQSINYHVIISGTSLDNQSVIPCNYQWNNPSQSINYHVIIRGTTLDNQYITM